MFDNVRYFVSSKRFKVSTLHQNDYDANIIILNYDFARSGIRDLFGIYGN